MSLGVILVIVAMSILLLGVVILFPLIKLKARRAAALRGEFESIVHSEGQEPDPNGTVIIIENYHEAKPNLPHVFCEHCGAKNKGESRKCEDCGAGLR